MLQAAAGEAVPVLSQSGHSVAGMVIEGRLEEGGGSQVGDQRVQVRKMGQPGFEWKTQE